MIPLNEIEQQKENPLFIDVFFVIALIAVLAFFGFKIFNHYSDYEIHINLNDPSVNISKIVPKCFSDSDCGVSQYFGEFYCRGDLIVRDFLNVSCLNPGRKNARCVKKTERVKLNECNFEEEVCWMGECTQITCTNGFWDLGEIGIDCGGACRICNDSEGEVIPEAEYCSNLEDDIHQKALVAQLTYIQNETIDNVSIDWFKVTYDSTPPLNNSYEGFFIATINSHGILLCGENIPLLTNNPYIVRIPYKPNIDKFIVLHENRIVNEIIVIGCNENGVCERSIGETYLGCQNDCRLPD